MSLLIAQLWRWWFVVLPALFYKLTYSFCPGEELTLLLCVLAFNCVLYHVNEHSPLVAKVKCYNAQNVATPTIYARVYCRKPTCVMPMNNWVPGMLCTSMLENVWRKWMSRILENCNNYMYFYHLDCLYYYTHWLFSLHTHTYTYLICMSKETTIATVYVYWLATMTFVLNRHNWQMLNLVSV